MGIQKSEAIVLKVRNFRETSLLINFFTKDFGKISGLIKGIRNEPQRYGGIPLVLSKSLIVFYTRQNQDLNLVTQCDAEELFQGIRGDLSRSNYAQYFLELLDTVTQPEDKNEQLFELLLSSLRSLGQQQPRQGWQIARIFEIKLLKLSGFKPRLDACVNCQREIAAEARFSASLGGILCLRCLGASSNLDKDTQPILKGTLTSIEYIEKSSWQKALQLKVGLPIAKELAEILSKFLDIHLDKKIKSREFLN